MASATRPAARDCLTPPATPGWTVADLAARFRVSRDKVRRWIKCGVLPAIDTADARCGRPRYVVTSEALATFEHSRAAGDPKSAPRRNRRAAAVDYFPDW
jgi:hypothetical protein